MSKQASSSFSKRRTKNFCSLGRALQALRDSRDKSFLLLFFKKAGLACFPTLTLSISKAAGLGRQDFGSFCRTQTPARTNSSSVFRAAYRSDEGRKTRSIIDQTLRRAAGRSRWAWSLTCRLPGRSVGLGEHDRTANASPSRRSPRARSRASITSKGANNPTKRSCVWARKARYSSASAASSMTSSTTRSFCCAAMAAIAWRIPRMARAITGPVFITTDGSPCSCPVSKIMPSGCPNIRSGSISAKASIETCRNGLAAMVCRARAVEVLPTLPTPLRMMTCGLPCTA